MKKVCYSCGELRPYKMRTVDIRFDTGEKEKKYFCTLQCYYNYEQDFEYFMINTVPIIYGVC